MNKLLFFLSVLMFLSLKTYSQNQTLSKANEILNERQELYFYFKANHEEIHFFNSFLSIDSYSGEYAFAYANPKQFERFLKTKKDFDIVHSYYCADKSLSMAHSIADMSDWDKYPTYEVYVEMMQKYATDFPELCRLDTIGYSHDGRKILMLNISNSIEESIPKPQFLYSGQMHGDELVSGFLFLRLIDYMLNNYDIDTRVTKLINELDIFINPYANPDGTYYGGNHTVAESRRSNNQNIDLNRNFPDAIAGNNPDGNPHATETVVFMEHASSHNFIMSGNSHSGAEVMNYPYDTYSVLPADNDWWYFVCREYADNAQENSPHGYFTDLNNGVTNGYTWYSITGGRQDYMNYFHHCREVTLELSTVKKLDSDLLPAHWDYNKKALLDYMEQATYGLRGFVTDSITEIPLKARVFINNHDFFNSHIYSNEEFGDYYRLLYEGDYNVTFSADGYKSKSFDVSVQNYEQELLDVQLVSLDLLPPTPSFYVEQNIFNCSPAVSFINTSEASDDTDYLWNFGDGNTSSEKNPTHIYTQNGTYNVTLTAQNNLGVNNFELHDAITIDLVELENYENVVICGEPVSTNLSVLDDGEIHWFNNINDENEFYIGNTYETPVMESTTSYYVQSVLYGQTYNLGEPDNSEGGDYNTSSASHYLIFDCFSKVILESVKVYSSQSGERTIFLSNSDGEVIETVDVFIEEGEQIVELNIDLPIQNDLRLGCYGPSNLFRGFRGGGTFEFPYQNEHVVIKSSNTTWWNDHTRFYSYFFDWQIREYDCVSERTEITVFVNEDVIADFEYEVEENLVSFINKSFASDSFDWNFGDGNNSQEKNPVHQYQEEGNFTVSLQSQSDCSSDIIEKTILIETGVNNIVNDEIQIYPNPVYDFLNVTATIKPISVSIFNAKGVKVFKSGMMQKNHKIDLNSFSPGLYFVMLIDNEKIVKSKKIVIL